MLPPRARAVALVLVVLAALPGAWASHEPAAVHRPDLVPTSARPEGTDEREPTRICFEVYNLVVEAEARTRSQYNVDVKLDRIENGSRIPFANAQMRSTKLLGPVEAEVFCFSFQLSQGTYSAYLSVDTGGEVDESNETNNVQTHGSQIRVRPRPMPDLAFLGLTIDPKEARSGFPQLFRARIVNHGALESPTTNLSIVDGSGLNRTVTLLPLRPRQATEVVIQTEPSERQPGVFTATLTLDPWNAVPEEDERNNVIRGNYSIAPHPQPDLVVSDLRVDGRLDARRAIAAEARVENVGNKTARTVNVSLRVDGVVAGERTIDALAPGANSTVRFPLTLLEGNRTLLAYVDPEFRIAELNESNNSRAISVNVTPRPEGAEHPNLVVARISALPEDPGPGEPITLQALIHNAGELAANASTVTFVLDGRRLGNATVPALAPDRYHVAVLPWGDHVQGAHTLRVTVDPLNAVREAYEDDNNETLFFSVLPPRVEAPPTNVSGNETVPPPANETNSTAPPEAPPTTPTPSIERPELALSQVTVGTKPVPGGLRGTVTAQLRNLRLDPVSRISIQVLVDGAPLKELLVPTLAGAALAAPSTGEVDLPPGAHNVSVEVRVLGAPELLASASTEYDAAAGEKGVPGPAVAALVAALAVAALAMRRRRA